MCARSTCTFCIVRLFSMFQSLSLATLVKRTEHLPSKSAAKTLHYCIHTSSNPRSRSLLHPLPLLSTLLSPGNLSIYLGRRHSFTPSTSHSSSLQYLRHHLPSLSLPFYPLHHSLPTYSSIYSVPFSPLPSFLPSPSLFHRPPLPHLI